MAKNVVAVKSKGFTIAHSFIDRACKDAAYLGVALAQDGKLLIHHEPKRPTVEGVNSILEKFKDTTVLFCFGENVKTLLEEDRLPFLVSLDKTKGDEVAVFITGDFQGYEVKNSSHTDEYHCFEEFLSKKLPKIYRGAGSDLSEFLKELSDPITQQDLSNAWTNRGFISMLASNGESVTVFNKGNVFVRKYSWGTVSDGLGFEEKSAEPPKEEPKKLSLLDKVLLKKEGKPIPSEAASVPAVAAPSQSVSAAAISSGVTGDQWEDVKLPPEGKDWTNKKKIAWWISEVGYKPNGYKDMKTIVKRTKGTKKGMLADLADANGDLPPIVHDAATAGSEDRKITDSTAMDHKEQVTVRGSHPMSVDPKTLPDKVAPEGMKDTAPKHVSVDNIPILSPKQKLLLRKEFLADSEIIKVLGDDFQAMAMAPKQLKELEDNYQPFWDGLGKTDNPYLSFEGLMKLGTLDIKSLAVLAFNNQNDRVKAELKLQSLMKSNPNLKLAM